MAQLSNRDGNSCVSVIIPTRNRSESLLPRAVKSVLAQTHTELELIVVDDASTDGTAEFVKNLGDPRVRYFRHETCKGHSATRNTGIEVAKGNYIAFLDDDDEWKPQKLEVQLKAFDDRPEYDLVYSGWTWINQQTNRVELERVPEAKGLLGGFPRWFHNQNDDFLVRTPVIRAVNGYFQELGQYEGTELLIRLAQTCYFGFVKDVLVTCWTLPGPRASDVVEAKQARSLVYDIEYMFATHGEFIMGDNPSWAELNLRLCATQFRFLGNPKAARNHIWASLTSAPSRKIVWGYALASILPFQLLRSLGVAKRCQC